jgi:hypothetical protein
MASLVNFSSSKALDSVPGSCVVQYGESPSSTLSRTCNLLTVNPFNNFNNFIL